MKKAIIIIVIVLVLGGGVALLLGSRDDTTEDNNTNNAPSTTETTQNTEEQTSEGTTVITYSDSGFIPGTLTVKAGTTLTVTNNSSGVLQFSSDSHPTHTDNPELNLKSLEPGESLMFTPTVKGTHGVHNHLDEAKTMTLIVE